MNGEDAEPLPPTDAEQRRARQILRHFVDDEIAQRLLIAWIDVEDRTRGLMDRTTEDGPTLVEEWGEVAKVVPALVISRERMLFRIRACRLEKPWIDQALVDLVTAITMHQAGARTQRR